MSKYIFSLIWCNSSLNISFLLSRIKLYILLLTLVLNSLLSMFSFIIWGWKAELLKFKDKFKDGVSSVILIFLFSFEVIVLVTNLGLIIFLLLFLPPLSLFKSKKLFGIFEFFSFWITLKGKLTCSGIGEAIFGSTGEGGWNESDSSGFFDNCSIFWEFVNILVGFIFCCNYLNCINKKFF